MKDELSEALSFNDFKYSRDFFDIKVSKKYYLLVFILVSFLLSLFLWSIICDIDVVVKGSAEIRPQEDVSVIKLQNGGFVSEKKYQNGQIVKQGDILLTFNTTAIQEEIDSIINRLYRNEIKLNVVNDLERMVSENKIIEELSPEAIVQAQVYFAQKKVKELNYEKLKNDYFIELSLPEDATYKQKQIELKNASDIAEADLHTYIANFKYSLITQKETLLNEKDSLKKEKVMLDETCSQGCIKAAKTGIIEELESFNCGDFLLSGTSVLRIIPLQNDKLKALIMLSQNDIADLKTGQQVKIKLNAFNSNDYGQIKGIVTRIGADSLYDANHNPYYQVDVEILQNYLKDKKNRSAFLRPGMTGIARIVIKRKKIIKVFLDKLNF